MINISRIENVGAMVGKRIKELQPSLIDRYLNANTNWMIRNVLECDEQCGKEDKQ